MYMSSNKIKSRGIPQGDFQRIVKSVSEHSSKEKIGRLIYKSSLKDSVNKCVYNEANKECMNLCSRKDMSLPRNYSSENVASFSASALNVEIQKRAPLLHGILQHVVQGSDLETVVTGAIALKFHSKHLSAFHHVVAHILDHGGATDEVFSITVKSAWSDFISNFTYAFK